MGLSLEKIRDFIEDNNFNQILLVQAECQNTSEQIKTKDAAQKAKMQNQWDTFILNLKQYNKHQTPVSDTFVKVFDVYFKNVISSFTSDTLEKAKL